MVQHLNSPLGIFSTAQSTPVVGSLKVDSNGSSQIYTTGGWVTLNPTALNGINFGVGSIGGPSYSGYNFINNTYIDDHAAIDASTVAINLIQRQYEGAKFDRMKDLYYYKEFSFAHLPQSCLPHFENWFETIDYEDFGVSFDKKCMAFNSELSREKFASFWESYLNFFDNDVNQLASSWPMITPEFGGTYVGDSEGDRRKPDVIIKQWKYLVQNLKGKAKREKNGWVFEHVSDAVLFKMWKNI